MIFDDFCEFSGENFRNLLTLIWTWKLIEMATVK